MLEGEPLLLDPSIPEWRKQLIRATNEARSVVGDEQVLISSVLDRLAEKGVDGNNSRAAIWYLVGQGEIELSWEGTVKKIPDGQEVLVIEPDAI